MGAEKEKDAKQATLAVTWGIALLVGVVTCVILFMFADIGSVTGTVVLAAIVTAIVGFALQWGMKDLPPLGSNVGSPSKLSPKAPEPSPPTPPAAAGTPQPPASAGPNVKSSAPLPGEAELAGRKGSWKYEGDAGAATPGESAGQGSKPETLSAPRGGEADDLKQMKGVGPKLEQTLHEAGIYHFDQIASWSSDEVAWVEENVDGARGRVTRDDWVGQAKALAR